MQFFSQRKGLKPVKSIVQKDSMDDDLRLALWNVVYDCHFKIYDGMSAHYHEPNTSDYRGFWSNYIKKPLDELPKDGVSFFTFIKRHFFSIKWNEVYDFIEAFTGFLVPYSKKQRDYTISARFFEFCNEVLKHELSAYRLICGRIVEITSEEEILSIEAALTQSLNPVKEHLSQAIDLYRDRKNPDYRNSMKESISAVESMCKLIANTPSSSLGKALVEINRNQTIPMHKSLRQALDNLYGYTSDASGIRHGMVDEPNVDAEDARFMLVTCSAFINYLTEKAHKAGLKL